LERLLTTYSSIKLCLDTSRLFLQAQLDPFFDAEHTIRRYAKYAKVIHLSSMRYTAQHKQNHYPALPDLKPEDGWTPIEAYMRIIRTCNPNVKIQFEHRSELISDEQLEQCYAWIEELLYK